jgi:magnesium chelatase family protein
VESARALQDERVTRGEVGARTNATLPQRDVERVASPCRVGQQLLRSAVDRLGLSARAYGKVLRVARTIADLDGSAALRPAHVAEAIGLRVLDRGASVAGLSLAGRTAGHG